MKAGDNIQMQDQINIQNTDQGKNDPPRWLRLTSDVSAIKNKTLSVTGWNECMVWPALSKWIGRPWNQQTVHRTGD